MKRRKALPQFQNSRPSPSTPSARRKFGIRTGRKPIVTPEGHVGFIGEYKIITRTNVYGTGILARRMPCWVEPIGSKMLLKGRPELPEKVIFRRQEKSFTP